MRQRAAETERAVEFPAGQPPRRGRGPILIAVAVVAVLVLGAGAVVFLTRQKPKPAPKAVDPVPAVEKAYLAYWDGLDAAHIHLDLKYVKPFLTDAGYAQEQKAFASEANQGSPYELTADHHLLTKVFEGTWASIDDLMLEHRVPVDSASLQPTAADQPVVLHNSYVLRLQSGQWLVDSAASFGSDHTAPGVLLSYAALNSAQPSASTLQSVSASFESYWRIEQEAYRSDDSSVLSEVEIDPQLTTDRNVLSQFQQQGRAWQYQVVHNYRIGQKDASHIYVYDTFVDFGHPIDLVTGSPRPATPANALRQGFELVKDGQGWKIAEITGYS